MGVGVAGAVVVACGDGTAGELLEDAGQLLVDAGAALVDAGSGADGSADAQTSSGVKSETHEVACTDALVRTETAGSTTTRDVVRLADVATNTSDITGVDVIVCGREAAPYPAETCPQGATCSGSAQLRQGDCGVSYVVIEAGKVRAACGTFTEVNGVLQPGWQRWKTARITIRR
jgi:hypothetical protein